MDLWKLLGVTKDEREGSPDLGRLFADIEKIMEGRTAEELKLITGIAGLLGHVAHADLELSEQETARIRHVLGARSALDPQMVDSILALLRAHRTDLFSLEHHIYIRLINQVADSQQKIGLLKTLFSVAAADQSISAEEDATLRTIARGLKLSHRDFVDARMAFREHRDVFKD